jgi:23S rRNA (guanosine2251-2'-O)-methyltransferase
LKRKFANESLVFLLIVMNRKLKLDELNRVSVQEFKNQKKLPIIVVLDNIRSLNNIGSFFRTSDAFNIEAIYLCGITAQPPHREIQKTALGATESVEWKYFETTEQALVKLKENEFLIYAIEQTENSIYLQEFTYNLEKIALVFGNEVEGVGQNVINLSKNSIEIPQFGTKHSLNVSISYGVVLWHLANQGFKGL